MKRGIEKEGERERLTEREREEEREREQDICREKERERERETRVFYRKQVGQRDQQTSYQSNLVCGINFNNPAIISSFFSATDGISILFKTTT